MNDEKNQQSERTNTKFHQTEALVDERRKYESLAQRVQRVREPLQALQALQVGAKRKPTVMDAANQIFCNPEYQWGELEFDELTSRLYEDFDEHYPQRVEAGEPCYVTQPFFRKLRYHVRNTELARVANAFSDGSNAIALLLTVQLLRSGTEQPRGLSDDEYASLCRDYAAKSSMLHQSLVRLKQALGRGMALLQKDKLDTLVMPPLNDLVAHTLEAVGDIE